MSYRCHNCTEMVPSWQPYHLLCRRYQKYYYAAGILLIILACGIFFMVRGIQKLYTDSYESTDNGQRLATSLPGIEPTLLNVSPTVRIFIGIPTRTNQPVTSTPEPIPSPGILPSLIPSTAETITDPAEFIRGYYQSINNRNYQYSWEHLSHHFIAVMSEKSGHSYTYSGDYAPFYETVDHIDVIEAITEHIGSQSADVLLTLRWDMKTGESPVYKHRFHLIKDPNVNSWLIDSTETWK